MVFQPQLQVLVSHPLPCPRWINNQHLTFFLLGDSSLLKINCGPICALAANAWLVFGCTYVPSWIWIFWVDWQAALDCDLLAKYGTVDLGFRPHQCLLIGASERMAPVELAPVVLVCGTMDPGFDPHQCLFTGAWENSSTACWSQRGHTILSTQVSEVLKSCQQSPPVTCQCLANYINVLVYIHHPLVPDTLKSITTEIQTKSCCSCEWF